MDIRLSRAVVFLVSAAYCADVDVYTAVKLGMQSGPRYLTSESQQELDNGINAGKISQPRSLPEFFDLSVNASIKVVDNFSLKPYLGLKLNEASIGAVADLTSPIFDHSAELTTYIDVYRDIAWDKVKPVGRFPLAADVGVNADILLHDNVSMFVGYRHPLLLSKPVMYSDQYNLEISYQPNILVGLKFEMSLYHVDESDPYIIQDPISIIVDEDIMVEEQDEEVDFEEVVLEDTHDELEPTVEEAQIEEEPMGWFAWIIEFFAKLFRF